MTFNTEKNKLNKLWNKVEDNKNIIITQKDNNSFIIDNIDELNRTNSFFPILKNFTSDWITPTILTVQISGFINPGTPEEQGVTRIVPDGNFQEFRLTFNTTDANFIPYIHAEIIYKVGDSGVIPINFGIHFDEDLANTINRLEKSEIYQFTETSVEYITYIRMDFFNLFDDSFHPEVQYKFIVYIFNPNYYQSN